MKIQELLLTQSNKLKENNIEDATNKARRILAFLLSRPKEYLITHNNEEVNLETEKTFNNLIKKLIKGTPIQYIIGTQEFMGIDFKVNKDVLIPQPDTETLVEKVIEIANNIKNSKILDLCTGSGAIAVSMVENTKDTQIFASDISEKALSVAKQNDRNNKVTFIKSDLFKEIKDKFDIIVSNPPYIKTEEIKTLSKEVQNEPMLALDGGQDGLDFYRKIIEQAYKYLNINGYLCLEIGEDQKKKVIELIEENKHYTNIKAYKDLAGNDRVIICKNIP